MKRNRQGQDGPRRHVFRFARQKSRHTDDREQHSVAGAEKRLRDFIDQIGVAVLVDDPDHRHAEGCRFRHETKDTLGYHKRLEIGVGAGQLQRIVTVNGHDIDRSTIGETANDRRGQCVDNKKRIELPAQHQVNRRCRVMFRDTDAPPPKIVGCQNLQGRRLCAGPRQANGNAHLAQIRHAADVGAATRGKIDGFAIDTRDCPQIAERLFAAERGLGTGRQIQDRCGDNGRIEVTDADGAYIGNRPGRRLRHRHKTRHATWQAALATRTSRRTADRRRQSLAHRKIFIAHGAGADLEECDLVGLVLQTHRRVPVEQRCKTRDQREGQGQQERSGRHLHGRQSADNSVNLLNRFPGVHGPFQRRAERAKSAKSFNSYN